MACMTLNAPMAMATTQLARVIRYEDVSILEKTRVERTPLRMSWVVATDGDGKRTLRMCWTADC